MNWLGLLGNIGAGVSGAGNAYEGIKAKAMQIQQAQAYLDQQKRQLQAAFAGGASFGSGAPPPGFQPGGGAGAAPGQPQPAPGPMPGGQMQGAPGPMPGGGPPGGMPQPPMPGQPSMPMAPPGGAPQRPMGPPGSGGAPPMGMAPPGGGSASPGAMPPGGASPGQPGAGPGGSMTIDQLADRIRDRNPGIDNATLFMALTKASALLAPQDRMLMQQTLGDMRLAAAKDRNAVTEAIANMRVQSAEDIAKLKGDISMQIAAQRSNTTINVEGMREKAAGERQDTAETGRDRRFTEGEQGKDYRAGLSFDARNAATQVRKELGEASGALNAEKLKNTQWYQGERLKLQQAGLSERAVEAEMRERTAQMRDETTRRGQDISSADRQSAVNARIDANKDTKEYRDAIVALKNRGLNDTEAQTVVRNRLAERAADLAERKEESGAATARENADTRHELGLLANEARNKSIDVRETLGEENITTRRELGLRASDDREAAEAGRNTRQDKALAAAGERQDKGIAAKKSIADLNRDVARERMAAQAANMQGNKDYQEASAELRRQNTEIANFLKPMSGIPPDEGDAKFKTYQSMLDRQQQILDRMVEIRKGSAGGGSSAAPEAPAGAGTTAGAAPAPTAAPAAGPGGGAFSHLPSATGSDGTKIYWDGKRWVHENGEPYAGK
jgi:hypothetical protein